MSELDPDVLRATYERLKQCEPEDREDQKEADKTKNNTNNGIEDPGLLRSKRILSAVTDVVGEFSRGEAVQGLTDNIRKSTDGSGLGLPEKFCEFGKGHRDRIESAVVGRQD